MIEPVPTKKEFKKALEYKLRSKDYNEIISDVKNITNMIYGFIDPSNGTIFDNILNADERSLFNFLEDINMITSTEYIIIADIFRKNGTVNRKEWRVFYWEPNAEEIRKNCQNYNKKEKSKEDFNYSNLPEEMWKKQ